MTQAYEQRLRAPLTGDDRELFTKSGKRLATGYRRIVVGDRGPYVEFGVDNLDADALRVTNESHHYYIELRSVPDDVKIYVQVHPVDYADYLPGMCYVSPFELYNADGQALIDPLRHSR